jgi:hypothetical protein
MDDIWSGSTLTLVISFIHISLILFLNKQSAGIQPKTHKVSTGARSYVAHQLCYIAGYLELGADLGYGRVELPQSVATDLNGVWTLRNGIAQRYLLATTPFSMLE